MRIMGHNLLAILVAAVAIYMLEFLQFAVIIPGEQYMAMMGLTEAQGAAAEARMPIGVVMPILAALGLSVAIKWRGAPGAVAGASTAVIVGVLFAFSASMYGYVYGAANEQFLLANLIHFVGVYAVAGAIIGAWK